MKRARAATSLLAAMFLFSVGSNAVHAQSASIRVTNFENREVIGYDLPFLIGDLDDTNLRSVTLLTPHANRTLSG